MWLYHTHIVKNNEESEMSTLVDTTGIVLEKAETFILGEAETPLS